MQKSLKQKTSKIIFYGMSEEEKAFSFLES